MSIYAITINQDNTGFDGVATCMVEAPNPEAIEQHIKQVLMGCCCFVRDEDIDYIADNHDYYITDAGVPDFVITEDGEEYLTDKYLMSKANEAKRG